MQLSTKGRYAVMAVIDVAKHCDVRPVSLSEVAVRQDISLPYLEQLFMKLRRHGLVKSVRGPGGGYLLNRKRGEIRIGDIMLAVGEPVKMTRCDGATAPGCMTKRRCTTHNLWQALGDHISDFLNKVTLDDVLEGKLMAPQGHLKAIESAACPPVELR
jgi:Rrf2 family iron-sulfur cluster assembly transcriptional regulator